MLTLDIKSVELFDEKEGTFTDSKGQVLQLEHSLVSLSKWESKWLKPFLTKGDKSKEETIDYIRCMTITQNVPPDVYIGMTQTAINQVVEYIDQPMTATTFPKEKGRNNNQIITSELIYSWMVSLNIPFECQKWHLNRLLALIKVCNINSQPKKKKSKKQILEENRSINEARKAELKTKG